MTTYTPEYRAKARERMRRLRSRGLHPCADCSSPVSATATHCAKHAAIHREERLEGIETERGQHWQAKRARGLPARKKNMSTHRPLELHSPAISRVIVDSNAMLPSRVKYPGGRIGQVIASNRPLMELAAEETGAQVEFDPVPFTKRRQRRYEPKFAVVVRHGDCEAVLQHFLRLQVEAFHRD